MIKQSAMGVKELATRLDVLNTTSLALPAAVSKQWAKSVLTTTAALPLRGANMVTRITIVRARCPAVVLAGAVAWKLFTVATADAVLTSGAVADLMIHALDGCTPG